MRTVGRTFVFSPPPPTHCGTICANQWVSRRLEDIVDAILYVGRKHTSAPIAPDLCADSGYIKMRLDRIALVDLPQEEADRVKRLCNVK